MANDKTTKDRRTIGIQITPPPLDAAGLDVLAELEAGGGRADVTPVISRLVRAELRRMGIGRAKLREITLLPAGVATDARTRREAYAVRIRKAIVAHEEAPPREAPPDQLAAWCPACRAFHVDEDPHAAALTADYDGGKVIAEPPAASDTEEGGSYSDRLSRVRHAGVALETREDGRERAPLVCISAQRVREDARRRHARDPGVARERRAPRCVRG